jgi:hypothetical protein
MPYVATMKGYLKSHLLNRAVDTTPAAASKDRAGQGLVIQQGVLLWDATPFATYITVLVASSGS